MKKFILCLLVAAFNFSFISLDTSETAVDAVVVQNVIGIARGAIKSTCPNSQGNLTATVQIISSCGVGDVSKVIFLKEENCPGNPHDPCVQIVEVVGYVIVDCNGNVIDIFCEPAYD